MKYRHPPSLLFPYFLPFLPPSLTLSSHPDSFLSHFLQVFLIFCFHSSSFLFPSDHLSSFFSSALLFSHFLPLCSSFLFPYFTSFSHLCPFSSTFLHFLFLSSFFFSFPACIPSSPSLSSSLPLLLSFLPPLTLFSSRLSLFLPHFSPLFPDLHSPRVSSPCSRVT